jgi:hypothetical protein
LCLFVPPEGVLMNSPKTTAQAHGVELMSGTLRLIITPVGAGELTPESAAPFRAELAGTLIVKSHQPLVDGARKLLEQGYGPDTLLTVRHHDRDYDSFPPQPIGELAGLAYAESARTTLRLKPWEPFPAAGRRQKSGSEPDLAPDTRGQKGGQR